jgi:hypothetical protein
MSISVSVPSCCRRRSSALNVTASPFRSNAWDRRRPPCRHRTRHRTAPFFRTRRSISTPLLPGSSSLPSRMPPHPDGHTRPHSRSTPGQPRRTLTGKPWARLPAPFLVTTWGAGSLAHRRARTPGAAGLSGGSGVESDYTLRYTLSYTPERARRGFRTRSAPLNRAAASS